MTRGVGEVSGPAALAWVAGTGLVLLATALGLALVRRGLRRRAAAVRASGGSAEGPYRTADPAAIPRPVRGRLLTAPEATADQLEAKAHAMGFQLWAVVATLVLVQLLYVGVYLEALRTATPSIQFDLFFWVLVVAGSVVLGSVVKTWRER